MNLVAASFIVLVGSFTSCSAPKPSETRPAARAPSAQTVDPGWLAGVWTGEHDSTTIEEYWTPLADGNMLGAGRELAGGKLAFFEHLRIEDRSGTWYYVALPNGRNATDFVLARGSAGELVFENLAHDFPQRITYRLLPDDALLVRVEGKENGSARAEEYRLRR